MNFDFREMYRVGMQVNLITDDRTMHAKIVKVTAFCVHCQTDNERLAINRNDSGDLHITATKEEVYIETLNS